MDTLLSIITYVGIICTIISVIWLVRFAHSGVNGRTAKKGMLLRITVLVLSAFVTLTGLVCESIFYPQGGYYWTIEEAVEEFSSSSKEYIVFDRIDTDLNPTPIIFAYEDTSRVTSADTEENVTLTILPIETEEWMGRKKYLVKKSIRLVDTWIKSDGEVTELITEDYVYNLDEFPGIWFGVVYPDKKDSIQINGKRPELHDFNFMGTDYVFWYIARDEAEPVLTFEG